jgi:hypothetical protein
MKTLIVAFILLTASLSLNAQDKYFTREGTLSFFSKAPLEDIEAQSKNGIAIFDTSNGEVIARVSIKTFDFEKDLMEEHFNENYLESDKYPSGEFKGALKGFNWDDFLEKKKNEYQVEGMLTIHGETNKILTNIVMELEGSSIKAAGEFKIPLKDYKIKIPKMVIKNIAEEILVTLEFTMDKLD